MKSYFTTENTIIPFNNVMACYPTQFDLKIVFTNSLTLLLTDYTNMKRFIEEYTVWLSAQESLIT